ncbi:hypothetical protein [Amycolatopsis sp. 195334CR]|uniref:hypothetical protein n=1 Tax=Amycolatopsis sp. 195334CR TaxID=2814588 RepID=UPI001A8F575E|nr:hypothetical protein [Amycolatopsis sp. 195334CR]MBN6040633.1 hypothetical protein [Amycolatopsis sp. 195334CR]
MGRLVWLVSWWERLAWPVIGELVERLAGELLGRLAWPVSCWSASPNAGPLERLAWRGTAGAPG